MKPKKGGRHRIYHILNRLHEFKQTAPDEEYTNICPIYSPPQECVKGKCVWYDEARQECWILNPKPLKDKPGER